MGRLYLHHVGLQWLVTRLVDKLQPDRLLPAGKTGLPGFAILPLHGDGHKALDQIAVALPALIGTGAVAREQKQQRQQPT